MFVCCLLFVSRILYGSATNPAVVNKMVGIKKTKRENTRYDEIILQVPEVKIKEEQSAPT